MTAAQPAEPLLAARDIQGDSLAGFRKDRQDFIFLTVGDVVAAKRALRSLVPRLSPLGDVGTFNHLFRSMRRRRGEIPGTLSVTWANIAFSGTGIAKLASVEDLDRFPDDAFKLGLAQRSSLLGDPTDSTSPGHPANWLFGGPSKPVDAVLLVAADSASSLQETSEALRNSLTAAGGFEVVHVEECATRSDLPGHEHFGFRDGISQPAPRGLLAEPAVFLSPRLIDPADERSLRYARPGQPLVWPGEFLVGLERQASPPDDDLVPLPAKTPQPAWASNGSYLVIRRLRQDVAAFRRFCRQAAADLLATGAFPAMTPERVGALLVGRWPSGAPLVRSPDRDDPELGADPFAANDFGYAAARSPAPLRHQANHAPDKFPPAVADPAGVLCPHGAHVRKVNPRDQSTDIGGARATLQRQILRRGIPFGDPFRRGASEGTDRGLMFACYQASIERQFEFLTNNWANSPVKPRADPGGHDLVIGEAQDRQTGRQRRIVITAHDGTHHSVATDDEWVVPTGGEYFFAPSISAVRDVLSARQRFR